MSKQFDISHWSTFFSFIIHCYNRCKNKSLQLLKKEKIAFIVTLFLFLLSLPSNSATSEVKEDKNVTANGEVLYSIDFSHAANVSDIKKWFKEQGFSLEKDPSGLKLYYNKEAIVFETKKKLFSFMLKSDLSISNAKKIRIIWGVNTFPEKASYENKIRNEALMVYIYYGNDSIDSGTIFIPNSPYFLGLFLSKDDVIGKYYTGRHFKRGGRFVCLGNPKLDETIVSEFDLQKGFKEGFEKDNSIPEISGIGLEVETTSTGEAKAFIKKIEILG